MLQDETKMNPKINTIVKKQRRYASEILIGWDWLKLSRLVVHRNLGRGAYFNEQVFKLSADRLVILSLKPFFVC